MSKRSRDRRESRRQKQRNRWEDARRGNAPIGEPTEALYQDLWTASPPSLLTTDTAETEQPTRSRRCEV